MNFSETLKRLLNDRGLKQADLCRMTGIQTSLLSEYLSGKKSPAIGNAIKIANAFAISLDALVGKEPLPLAADEEVPGSMAKKLIALIEGMSEEEQKRMYHFLKEWQEREASKRKYL